MTRSLGPCTLRTMSLAGFAALMLSFAAPTPAAAEEGQNGQIHVQKVCPTTGATATFTGLPGSYCTIIVSDVTAIPANTARVYYDKPSLVPIGSLGFLDSKVVVYVGPGNWAVGRCTVDFSNGLGLCTISDGTGTLAGFSARIDVRIDFAHGITYWEGTYSFSPLPPR